MAINGYNVGKDLTIAVQTGAGPVTFNKITKFTARQQVTDVKVKRLDGITDHVRFPDGWTGTIEIERADSAFDDLIAQIEANYYAGAVEAPCTITQTIQEVSGAVSQYVYYGVLFTMDNAGDYQGDQTVKQTASFVATRRVKRL